MPAGVPTLVSIAIVWVLGCGAALAQDAAFPGAGADPQGVVLDEELRPIAGAAICLQWQEGDDVPFGRAIATRLHGAPLPATQSGRDGGYVLPLTNEQRQMGVQLGPPSYRISGCWLVVEKEGYLPWREAIPAGLPSYLGSRVLLRRVRADDVFADLPWPPAIVAVKTEQGYAPWLAPGEWDVQLSRRGGRAAGDGLAPADAAAIGELEVTVTAAGEALPRAQLWFDDGAFALPAGVPPLPSETGADGRVKARVPEGKRTLRVTAPGFLPAEVCVAVERGGSESSAIALRAARAVDVLAVSDTGVPVPFRELVIIPKNFADPNNARSSFAQFSDAQGRARVFVDDPSAWFVYSDRRVGGDTERVAFDAPANGGDGLVRVIKHRAITVRLRGDEWPRCGELRWEAAGEPVVARAFKFFERDAAWVVCRLCSRELDVTTIGGDDGVPFRIRREDLPPMPAEPLLDLVALDRSVRSRAELLLPADPGSVRRFVVQPPWQADGVRNTGDTIQCARQRDGRWLLLARDDAALDVVATALRIEPHAFTVPATNGAEPPRIELPLQKR